MINEIKRMQHLAGVINESQLNEEEDTPIVQDAKNIIDDLNNLGFRVTLVIDRKEQSPIGKGYHCYIDVSNQYNRIEIGLDKGAPLFQETGGGQKLQSLLKDKLSSKYDAKFNQSANNFVVNLTAKQQSESFDNLDEIVDKVLAKVRSTK
jgi:hypothetical protein